VADAERFARRLLRYRLVLDSHGVAYRGFTLFDARHDRDEVAAVVWLPWTDGTQQPGEVMVLRGRLEVIRHERRGQFGGYVELRLVVVVVAERLVREAHEQEDE
jgi:hypothetical protein